MARVLVTGGAGFIGTNLCEALVSEGNQVIALDNLSAGDGNVAFLTSLGVQVVVADIADYSAILPHFAGVSLVYHLAAMNRAPRSVEQPVQAHHTNITGTLYVLEAMRAHHVPKIIFASSSSVYAGRTGFLHEDDPVAPPHPYGVGKLAGEHYVRVYSELYGLTFVTLRFFSVYGPRQLGTIEHAAIIPKFIHAARTGESLTVYGDGSALRNYTYVSDVVRCCILAATKPEAQGTVINVANTEEVSSLRIAKQVITFTNSKSAITHLPSRAGDPPRNAPDVSRAKTVLGYTPVISYEDGIQRTIAWYDTNAQKTNHL